MIFFIFILLAFTVFRVTRFIAKDDLIKEPREQLRKWLAVSGKPDDVFIGSWTPPWWKRKLDILIDCAWCVSIWVSGFTMIVMLWVVDYDLPLPLFWWPAVSGAGVCLMEYTDGKKTIEVTKPAGQ